MRRGIYGLAFVLLVAGCAPMVGNDRRGAELADTGPPAAQSWALGDGVVTKDEYRTAIEGFISCVRNSGYEASDAALSPVDGLTLLYEIPPSGDPEAWNAKVEECNLAHVSHIEPAYIEAQQQVMDPELRDATAECLRKKGFQPQGGERNVKELIESTDKVGSATTECVTLTMSQLFPQAPGFLKIRW
jgi:hypothetical protein